jgi:hypothetical protein
MMMTVVGNGQVCKDQLLNHTGGRWIITQESKVMPFDRTRPAITALSIDNNSMTLANQEHAPDDLSAELGRRKPITLSLDLSGKMAHNLLWRSCSCRYVGGQLLECSLVSSIAVPRQATGGLARNVLARQPVQHVHDRWRSRCSSQTVLPFLIHRIGCIAAELIPRILAFQNFFVLSPSTRMYLIIPSCD